MTTVFKALFAAAALSLTIPVFAPALAHAAPAGGGETAFLATTLNVEASGEVKTAPDQATITLGVQTVGKTAGDAMQQNRQRMAAAIAALKSQGIEAKDIRTTALNLNAQYAYENGQAPRLTGYQASNEVSITVRDVAKLGATVDAVTGAGANQVTGISFGLADARPVEDEARRAAVKTVTGPRGPLRLGDGAEGGAAGQPCPRAAAISPQPMAPRVFAMAKAVRPDAGGARRAECADRGVGGI